MEGKRVEGDRLPRVRHANKDRSTLGAACLVGSSNHTRYAGSVDDDISTFTAQEFIESIQNLRGLATIQNVRGTQRLCDLKLLGDKIHGNDRVGRGHVSCMNCCQSDPPSPKDND